MDYKSRHIIQEKGEAECAYCGKTFRLTRDSGSVFCSRDCWRQALTEKKTTRLKAKELPVKTCEICGREYRPKTSGQRVCSDGCRKEKARRDARLYGMAKMEEKTYTCERCGKVFFKVYGKKNRKFCSESCARAFRKYTSKNKYKGKYENYNPVLIYKHVFARDGGKCKLCGLPVIEDKAADRYWSGTVDHIIPISRGGSGSEENCQLAHRVCNSLKNNNEDFGLIDWVSLGRQERWKAHLQRLASAIDPRGGSTFCRALRL